MLLGPGLTETVHPFAPDDEDRAQVAVCLVQMALVDLQYTRLCCHTVQRQSMKILIRTLIVDCRSIDD